MQARARCARPAARAHPPAVWPSARKARCAPRTVQLSAALSDAQTAQALSTDYDPEASERFFSQRPLLVWRRLAEISARLGGLYLRAFLRGSARPASDDLCALLATLGPTFVKLGQTLSTREDLIGRDLARSLSGLQMAAPPFDDAVAFQVIRAELHDEPRGLYQRFPDTHVAAASLGQVYQAELHNLDNSSEDLVAVKVQRPNLLGSIALDVYALRIGLGVVRRLAKINSDLRKIADEVGAGLFAELDYRVEASQAELFARAHAHLPYIDTVDVIERLSSKRVLTSKWIHGASPNALLEQCERLPEGSPARAALRARLVRMVNLGVECSLSQLLETGVMHADPHPGNLILTPADRLAYLDFGLLTFVPPRSSEAMMSCLVHVALGRWRAMADDLAAMGFLKDKIDRDALAAALEVEVTAVWPLAGSFGADSFLTDGSAQAGGMLAERIADGRVRTELGLGQGLSFGKLAKAIIKLAIRFRFNLPAYYTLIVRSLCSLEGLALRVDPTFSIVNAAIPIILRRMLTDPRRSAVGLLRELLLEEDARLRVGMLEGLLKNYSAEAGKSMQDSAAQNVVLKGVPSRAEAASNGAGAGVASSSEEDAEAADTRGVAVVAQAVADERALQRGGQPESFAEHSGIDHAAIRGNGAPTAVAEHLRDIEVVADSHASAEAPAGTAEHAEVGEAASAADADSLEAQVLGMVLSARAAGVRRVLLEADMKDMYEQVAGEDGAALRDRAAEVLSGVVTWAALPKLLATSLVLAVKLFASRIARILRLPRRAAKGGRQRRADVLGVPLTPAALKRAQLMAVLSFSKLWRQSWLAALASVWLGVRIVTRALFMRKSSGTAQAQAA